MGRDTTCGTFGPQYFYSLELKDGRTKAKSGPLVDKSLVQSVNMMQVVKHDDVDLT